jgi:hypothetical protein
VTVANTARDGTGTTVTVWTPGANGSILSKIVIEVPSTSLVDVKSLFWFDGTNKRLYDELLVTAITPSTTVSCFRLEYVPSTPEVYPSGWTLLASTHIGQATNVRVLGGDY